jgi:hypothetical protein
MTTALEKQYTNRITLTACPRCKRQPGTKEWPTSWLNELTIADGRQIVHALICRRGSCAFGEILGLRADPSVLATRTRRSWLRDAIARHPLTFAAASIVNGIAVGVMVALT